MFRDEFWKLMDSLDVNNTSVMTAEENLAEIRALHEIIKENLPEKLYRYQAFGEHSRDNLKDDTVYFSPIFRMNDKQECACFVDLEKAKSDLRFFMDDEHFGTLLEAVRHGDFPGFVETFGPLPQSESVSSEDVLEYFRELIYYFHLQIEVHGADLVADFLYALRRIFSTCQIACFTETYESSNMAALYGNHATGYVLEYNVKDLVVELEDVSKWTYSNLGFSSLLLPVRYSKEKQDATGLFLMNLSKEEAKRKGLNVVPASPDLMFFIKTICRKSDGFEAEREWRIIRPAFEGNEFSPQYLTVKPSRIMLLSSCTDEGRKLVCDNVETKNISVYRLVDDFQSAAYGKYYLLPETSSGNDF